MSEPNKATQSLALVMIAIELGTRSEVRQRIGDLLEDTMNHKADVQEAMRIAQLHLTEKP